MPLKMWFAFSGSSLLAFAFASPRHRSPRYFVGRILRRKDLVRGSKETLLSSKESRRTPRNNDLLSGGPVWPHGS